jgi:hypothetical protein
VRRDMPLKRLNTPPSLSLSASLFSFSRIGSSFHLRTVISIVKVH